jgi:hypothetical protein
MDSTRSYSTRPHSTRRSRRADGHRPLFLLAALLGLLLLPASADAGEHRLGLGAHFWKTVDDLADDFGDDVEEDGFAYVLSYQYLPAGLFRFEIDLEVADEGYGGAADTAYSPVVFVLVGRSLYGGVGVGVTFSDTFEDDVSDPFYAARVGYEFTLLPGVHLDLNANYRADAWSELDQADTDAVTLGALVRFNL